MPEEHASSGEDFLTLDSDLEELERLREFIDGFCERKCVPEETHYHLSVALEELVVNAIKHGACRPPEGAIRLSMQMSNDDVVAVLCDTGMAFNPLQVAPPDFSRNVLTSPPGGLGIHLVRCLIPRIRYERREDRNYLYLTKPVNRDRALQGKKGDADADRDGDQPA